ncbi:MAG: hypothetical protein P1V20_19580 [Verrucomicrobiales bacterium]|nr:hypothetical protein [Verrucomicrobiales bacterium]
MEPDPIKACVVETTTGPQEVDHGGLTFVDLPGCGTPNWPQASYVSDLNLRTFDCVILITADRFRESDLFLLNELTRMGVPCFFVRNRFDVAVLDGAHDNDLDEEQVRTQINQNIEENLGKTKVARIYLTSARFPTRYDFGNLVEDIKKKLQGIKRDRFIADMGAYREEALQEKQELAKKRVVIYAGLAAANGLNPIPGTDIAVDLGIIVKMAKEIAHIFGLDKNQVEFVKRLLGPKAIPRLFEKVAQFTTKYLAKEGIAILLKKMGKKVAAKTASKYVPFVGPAISATIGFHATLHLGRDLNNEAAELALEIIQAMQEAAEADIT